MTLTICDRCGTEMPRVSDVYLVEMGSWTHGKQRKAELCEECYEKLQSWLGPDKYQSYKTFSEVRDETKNGVS